MITLETGGSRKLCDTENIQIGSDQKQEIGLYWDRHFGQKRGEWRMAATLARW